MTCPLITCSAIVLGGTVLSLGQEVIFANNVLMSPPDRLVRREDGFGLVGTNWCAQLYYGRNEGSLAPVNAAPRPFFSGITTLPGWWSGARRTLDGFSTGESAILQVRVWDCALFSDYESAVSGAGTYGQSIAFSYVVPAAGLSNEAYWMENFQGFTLIPEPTTIALILMGGAFPFARLRRRKQVLNECPRRINVAP